MPISAARRITFDILMRVETQGAFASDLLHEELGIELKSEDAGLATEVTMGVLRRRSLLDFLIEHASGKKVKFLDREVTIALRMAIYQMRFLDRIPSSAAVNQSVELVKYAHKSSATSFVNAVLRRVSKAPREPIEFMLPAGLPVVDRLALMHSHPAWIVERWLNQFGEARTLALLESDNRAPELATICHVAGERESVRESLEREGLRVSPGRWLGAAFSVRGGGPFNTEAFRAGKISIQDEASQMVPLLADVQRGDAVLDLCAAPGGKTVTLGRASGAGGLVVAADRHAHRLLAMRLQLERLHLRGVRMVELDATQTLPFRRKFLRILVDAPCSGTGTLARHPEIRWRLKRKYLEELHARQVALLRTALDALEDGGRLVYSTCSLEAEENELAVEEVLSSESGYVRVPRAEMERTIAPHLTPGASAASLFDDAGAFRTFPPEHLTDGFFAVGIERKRS